MSTVREMIQIAFEYEVKIQQLNQALQQAQAKIEVLERTLASYTANSKPSFQAGKELKELVRE